jgi:hypothetical protein
MCDDANSLCRSMRLCRVCALRARYVVLLAPSRRCHSFACSQVLLNFLVSHGYLTSENEPRFLEINQRLHGHFDMEVVIQMATLS